MSVPRIISSTMFATSIWRLARGDPGVSITSTSLTLTRLPVAARIVRAQLRVEVTREGTFTDFLRTVNFCQLHKQLLKFKGAKFLTDCSPQAVLDSNLH